MGSRMPCFGARRNPRTAWGDMLGSSWASSKLHVVCVVYQPFEGVFINESPNLEKLPSQHNVATCRPGKRTAAKKKRVAGLKAAEAKPDIGIEHAIFPTPAQAELMEAETGQA